MYFGGFMKKSLHLHILACEELWCRRKIMQDPGYHELQQGLCHATASRLRGLLENEYERII